MYSITWNQATLKRIEYKNGKQRTSQSFKTVEDLISNKEKFESVQSARESKGADKINTKLI